MSSTGVTGLTIGSGSGWLERAMGLTSDSLIGGRLVTADGKAVSVQEDPELLWALPGGGGNFGVLTELEFALQPLGPRQASDGRTVPFKADVSLTRARSPITWTPPLTRSGGSIWCCSTRPSPSTNGTS